MIRYKMSNIIFEDDTPDDVKEKYSKGWSKDVPDKDALDEPALELADMFSDDTGWLIQGFKYEVEEIENERNNDDGMKFF